MTKEEIFEMIDELDTLTRAKLYIQILDVLGLKDGPTDARGRAKERAAYYYTHGTDSASVARAFAARDLILERLDELLGLTPRHAVEMADVRKFVGDDFDVAEVRMALELCGMEPAQYDPRVWQSTGGVAVTKLAQSWGA